MKFRYDNKTEELVVSSATRIEYYQLSLWLNRHVKGHRFHPAVKAGVWDGRISYFKNGRINFGLWRECLKGCREINASFILENKEDFPLNREITLDSVKEFCKDFFKDHKVMDKKTGEWKPFFPYDHQIETAFKIMKNKFCLAEVATSGGKSLIISIVMFYTLKYINPDAKFLLIVPSITLVTQFSDNILEYFYGDNNIKNVDIHSDDARIRIEEIMSDSPRKHKGSKEANIYIGTYQSLEKWPKEWFKQFHTVVCDEAHQSKAKTITTILERTFNSAYCRFGVSGTFPGDDTCEILTIQSVLGPKITEVSADELKKKGIITPMSIKACILNHNDLDWDSKMSSIRKGGNGKDAFNLEKDYIHISDRRIDFIKKIVDKCTTNTLILFHTIEYGQKLLDRLQKELPDKLFYYIDGSVSGKKRDKIKKEMELIDDKVRILIGSYGCFSTGESINNLHQLILTDSFKSESLIIQSIGRLLRLMEGKEKALIFDLIDVFKPEGYNNILYRHYKEREKFYIKRKYPYKEIKINL